MESRGFIGIDQYGEHYHIEKYPRKELLKHFGRQHITKMYCDVKGGKTRHAGYIISGRWVSIYSVSTWKEAK